MLLNDVKILVVIIVGRFLAARALTFKRLTKISEDVEVKGHPVGVRSVL